MFKKYNIYTDNWHINPITIKNVKNNKEVTLTPIQLIILNRLITTSKFYKDYCVVEYKYLINWLKITKEEIDKTIELLKKYSLLAVIE